MFLIGSKLLSLLISLADVKMCDILYLNSHLILVLVSVGLQRYTSSKMLSLWAFSAMYTQTLDRDWQLIILAIYSFCLTSRRIPDKGSTQIWPKSSIWGKRFFPKLEVAAVFLCYSTKSYLSHLSVLRIYMFNLHMFVCFPFLFLWKKKLVY